MPLVAYMLMQPNRRAVPRSISLEIVPRILSKFVSCHRLKSCGSYPKRLLRSTIADQLSIVLGIAGLLVRTTPVSSVADRNTSEEL